MNEEKRRKEREEEEQNRRRRGVGYEYVGSDILTPAYVPDFSTYSSPSVDTPNSDSGFSGGGGDFGGGGASGDY